MLTDFVHGLSDSAGRDARVYLCGGDASVPKGHLDEPQVSRLFVEPARLESGDKHILDVDGNVVRTLSREKRYGKADDDKVRLVLGCPERAARVQHIFRMYVDEGCGYKTIAEILNREGIPFPRNGTYARTARAGWSLSTIKSILENRIYDGSSVQTGYYICGGYLAKGRGTCVRAPIPKEMIEARVRSSIGDRVRRFLDHGGAEVLRNALTECLKRALDPPKADASRIRERLEQMDATIRRLVDSLSPVNKEFVDQRLLELKGERDELGRHLQHQSDRPKREISLDAIVDDILRDIRRFDGVFDHGTIEEQKDFVNLFVARIEVDPKEGRTRVHIRQFPAPASLVTGNVSFDVVAGARSEHQKKPFPPVDVVEVALVCKGRGARTIAPAST